MKTIKNYIVMVQGKATSFSGESLLPAEDISIPLWQHIAHSVFHMFLVHNSM